MICYQVTAAENLKNVVLGKTRLRQFSYTKIRPQAKIDNFDFKNSNIIIEGLFFQRKDFPQLHRF